MSSTVTLLETDPIPGHIYCEVDGQQYYIGSGDYIRASNPNSAYYMSIFLPFYGFSGQNSGKIYKYKGGNLPKDDESTILTHFLKLIRDDCDREVQGKPMKYIEQLADGNERGGYQLKTESTDGLPSPVIFSTPNTENILTTLNELLGVEWIPLWIVLYLNFLLKKMLHSSLGADVLTREGNNFASLLYTQFTDIEGLNGKQFGGIGFGATAMRDHGIDSDDTAAQLMIWLQRYNVDDGLQQVQTSLALTKCLMKQYPKHNFTYKSTYPWFRYVNGVDIGSRATVTYKFVGDLSYTSATSSPTSKNKEGALVKRKKRKPTKTKQTRMKKPAKKSKPTKSRKKSRRKSNRS